MRKAIAVFFVLLAMTPAIGITAAQTANETAANGTQWEPPGTFSRSELTTGGVHDAEAPDSVRAIGDPISGSVGIRASPGNPLQNEETWMSTGSTLESDRLDLYGTAYGDAVGEYELVIVYWSEASRQVNGSEYQYAADQSVQRVSFNMTRGYNNIPIELRSHYDERVQATMWLERGGGRVEGARWRYQHRSNPLSASPTNAVNSKGDLWRWGALNILLPAIPGVFIGRSTATHFLKRTITSPRKGTTWWLLLIGVLALLLVVGATWQTSALLSRAPFIAGLSIALLSFVAVLGVRDADVEKAELNKKDLTTVTSVSDEEHKDARSEEIRLRDIVRRDGRIYMPAKGIRPFIARYWADPASVDESDLKTVNNTEGDVSKKYEVDPAADEVMRYKPARLAFSPTIVEEKDETPELPADGDDIERDGESTISRLFSSLSRINWSFIAVALIGGLVGYTAMQAWLGIPSLSVLVGAIPAVVAGYEARDGTLHFEPAPYHFSEARANLVHERTVHREAKTFEDLYNLVADFDFEVLDKGTEISEVIEARFRERLNDDWDVDRFENDQSSDQPGVSDD